MIFIQNACIVLTTNKTSTTIEAEFKRAYDATLNQITTNSIPETDVDHRLLYETTDSDKITITVDGVTRFCLENNFQHDKGKVPSFCTFYDANSLHQLPADKPIIVIHVKQDKDSQVRNTNFNDLLHLCLSILVTLKHITINQTPIKQVIITADIHSLDYKKFKIVVDGQTIYEGSQKNTLGHRLHLLQICWRDLDKRISNICEKSAEEMDKLQPILSRVRQMLMFDVRRVIDDGDINDIDHVRDHVLDELYEETKSLNHAVEWCKQN